MGTQIPRPNSQASPWDYTHCERTRDCPPRCPRFVDKEGEGMLVRAFEPDDRADLEAMYDDFRRDDQAQGIPPLSRDRFEEWLEGLLEEGTHIVADRDGEIVGHGFFTPASLSEPELAVFIHPEWQNRGIGTEVCRHIIAFARDADRDGLVLDVEQRNRAAISVYRKLGFERTTEYGRELHMKLALDESVDE